jgi:energy-coupling factor transporter ATP-binding protein EcfA2
MSEIDEAEVNGLDPRVALADWANHSDEWTRFIVRQVLSTGRPLTSDDFDYAYDLFRQEKSLDPRVMPTEPELEIETRADESEQPLTITQISEVKGVNALTSGSVIEPHPGLTILFGENGTGIAGIKAVQAKIDAATMELTSGAPTLLNRFPKESSVYALIETLGASTDLEDLRARADDDPKIDRRIDVLRLAVAALESNNVGPQITLRQRTERVLTQGSILSSALVNFDVTAYNDALKRRSELEADYKAFRTELFEAADLPADPEETWEAFVSTGEAYRQHLDELDVHDGDRCLYCRQSLSIPAKDLVKRYGDYLAGKINADIMAVNSRIGTLTETLLAVETAEISTYLDEYREREDQPSFFAQLTQLETTLAVLRKATKDGAPASSELKTQLAPLVTGLAAALTTTSDELDDLKVQAGNRLTALAEKKMEASELVAAAELSKSWALIQMQVRNAKEADKLKILVRALPNLSRNVTDLAKNASDQLINQSFDKLFIEECKELRAPPLKLQFVGRQGKAQRRKVLSGKHKPSKILSEGEQKVLAMADFLAEARLSGITAPVIFDDPVSSLDHRRINEVAQRVALLAENIQVMVFTHDIFFATTLLSLFEKSKRCTYFQITDDDGIGKVTRATGPRWDSLKNIKAKVNESIQAAKAVDGEARAALVRTGYGWLRSWCEVFTETELLQNVSQRYQPNIRITALANIKTGELPRIIEIVTRIFEDACRNIDAHSQPLAALGVSPTLPGLEAHWGELQDCKKANDAT